MNMQFQTELNRFKSAKCCVSSAILLLFLTLFPMLGLTSPAHADFKVCNDTKSLTGVAIGYRNRSDWIMEGWWRIPAGVCASVVEGELSSRYFYLYAEDADNGGQWRGPVYMCTSSKEFKIEGLKDCFARGFERTGFFEIDTGNQQNWQVRLTESNQSKTAKPANK